jgi:phage terminase large subunit GpA-like protein
MSKLNRATIITLGVDSGKEEIVNRLKVTSVGPGYCHFPKLANDEPAHGYDEEYFKGLCAEQRVIKNKHGFRTYQWVKRPSQRNEPFDVRVYNLAALILPHNGIKLDTMSRDIEPDVVKRESSISFGVQNPAHDVLALPASSQQVAPSEKKPEAPRRSMWGAQNQPLGW